MAVKQIGVADGEGGQDISEARLEGMVVEEGSVDVLFDRGKHGFGVITGLLEQSLVVHGMLQHGVMCLGSQNEQILEILLLQFQ